MHPPSAGPPPPPGHIPALDGVRAISILAVLATHLLPLRVHGVSWNGSLGMFGMALFFVLSGYLVTRQLLQRPSLRDFALRRLCRILPAAWLCLAVVWLFVPLPADVVGAHALFYANLPPQQLAPPVDHYWSLCVELQFYALVMLLLLVRPSWAWVVLPALLLTATGLRIAHGVSASSVTWYRADDILAGAVLALVLHAPAGRSMLQALRPQGLIWVLLLALLTACILPPAGLDGATYLRPYLAAALVGALVMQPQSALARGLAHPRLAYIAGISYALYLWHIPLAATWLGSGDLLEKYLKRPLLFVVLFAVAHVSTHYFERHFIAWGKRMAKPRPVDRGALMKETP